MVSANNTVGLHGKGFILSSTHKVIKDVWTYQGRVFEINANQNKIAEEGWHSCRNNYLKSYDDDTNTGDLWKTL